MSVANDTTVEGATRGPRRLRALTVASLAVVAAAGLVIGSLALATQPGAAVDRPSGGLGTARTGLAAGATISVTGSGSVEGTPNEVSFGIGVETTAASAAEALARNDAEIARLESTLSRQSVTPSEMQTSSLQLFDNTNSSGQVTGFTVDDDLNVNMTDVAAAGAAIDAAAEAIGNGIQLEGISFSISNQSALLARARAAAMANARTEASDVAAGAGLTLGPVIRVTDEENGQSTIVPFDVYGAAAPSALNLEAGRQPVSVQVRVVYELRR